MIQREKEQVPASVWRIFLFLTLYIIALTLWRVIMPAHGHPGSSSVVWFSLIFDAAVLVVLFPLRKQLSALPEDDGRRGWVGPLFFFGVLGAAVSVLIRLTSYHGWWTGHLRYEFVP